MTLKTNKLMLTFDEALKEEQIAQDKIAEAIKQFEKNTGFTVTEINLRPIGDIRIISTVKTSTLSHLIKTIDQ